jgi:predicted RNA-binding protein with PIN domain
MDNLSSDLGEDRDRLLNDLCILRGVTGWAIEVIFDAYKAPPSPSSASPFSSGMKSRSQTVDGVVVTFTSNSETADNYIERRFEELRKSGFTNMVQSHFACSFVIYRYIVNYLHPNKLVQAVSIHEGAL